jgi:hypothetical protein
MDSKLLFDRNPIPGVASGRPIVGVFIDNSRVREKGKKFWDQIA